MPKISDRRYENLRLKELRILKTIIALTMLFLMSFNLVSCTATPENTTSVEDIKTYRDIPDITEGEITAIEAILARRQSFTYASLPSIDAFIQADGVQSGFALQVCKLLTDLFGVPFISQVLDWQELEAGINDHSIDFTSSINTPADFDSHHIHTSPVAEHKLSAFIHTDTAGCTSHSLGGHEPNRINITCELDLRGLKVGFFKDSHAKETMHDKYPQVHFESVDVLTTPEMAEMLQSGEIDVFITDTADVFEFYQHENVVKALDFPDIYIPMSISSTNTELTPILTAITRYLEAGGNKIIDEYYAESEYEYAAYVIRYKLSDEERAYIDNLKETGAKVPVGATSGRYPVAFIDKETGEYSGIAIDVLSEISSLTGLEFYFNCDETTSWVELESMLRTGEIAILSQLIPNEPRSEYALWPDKPYFTARYALLSNVDYPFLSINQVPYVKVGLAGSTAEENMYKTWFPHDDDYITYPTTDAGLTALENGEIDLFFCLDYTLLYESNYRENSRQKINIIFDEPIEPVPFGLNINEETLASIICKTQNIINTDRIARNWTSRIFDQSVLITEQRAQFFAIFSSVLVVLLFILSWLLVRSRQLKARLHSQVVATTEANETMKTLIDIAPAAIVITRRGDGTILYVNKGALDTFDLTSFAEQVEGRSSLEFMPEYQPDGVKSVDMVAAFWSLDSGTKEFELKKDSGKRFLGRIAYRAINFHGASASLNIIEDMTAEMERRQRLEALAQKEQEANQLKSRFLATMSHEIRTPMNAIIGMTDLALRETKNETKNDHILTIKQAGSNLLSIINDILDFSKIEAGKMELVEADYSVASLVNDVVNIIRMRAIDTGINFAVKASSSIPRTLFGDETRIRQAVLNILNNAVKYTEDGHVTLGVYAAPPTNSQDADEINLIFEVTDTGIGIKKENIEKLFSDFTQVDLENKKNIEGVGLGLAITQSIIEVMNGKIDVHSEYGKGSVFTITVPQKSKSSETIAAVQDAHKMSAIIFEKSEEYLDSLTYTMTDLGVDYLIVHSVKDLREQTKLKKYDFLFASFKLFRRCNTVMHQLGDTEIIILSEFGEINPAAESMLDKNMTVLTMPVYCTAVADILNGTYAHLSHDESDEAPVKFSAPNARVLVVDDIMSNLKVAEGMLEQYDMQVDLVNGGAKAVERIQRTVDPDIDSDVVAAPYDMIFMDHKMPGIDGIEATRQIRALGGVAENIPIVALTANAVVEVEQKLMSSGFNDFLSKPIDKVKLGIILDKWIPKDKRV